VLSLHAEACPELNGNSEGVVSCVFSFTAALFGARLAPLTYPQTSPVRARSCDYQVPFRHTSTHFYRSVIRASNKFESQMSHLFASLPARIGDSGY
jgi:hypothetical protein